MVALVVGKLLNVARGGLCFASQEVRKTVVGRADLNELIQMGPEDKRRIAVEAICGMGSLHGYAEKRMKASAQPALASRIIAVRAEEQ